MIWTLSDGTVARGYAEVKRLCLERGLDPTYFLNRERRGLARRPEGRRQVRLPDEWRSRLDAIFGPAAVHEFVRAIPRTSPAIVVAVNATDTAWSHRLMSRCAVMCGLRGRIGYVDVATGEVFRNNPRGTILYLFTDNTADVQRFYAAMGDVGCLGTPFSRIKEVAP